MPGLPADMMYSLDSCVEAGDMTADVHAYITLLDPDPLGWYDGLGGENFIRLMNATARQRMAAWRETADLDERAALTWIGINELPRTLKDSARHCLSEAVSLRGPALDPVSDLLSNRDFIADNAAPFMPSMTEIAMRTRDDVRLMGSSAFTEGRHLVAELHRRVGERRMQHIVEAERLEAQNFPQKPESRSLRKARRKPLAKAMDLLSQIGGRRTAQAFITGDDVIVTGRKFNFRARKGVMTSNGHGAINLTVTDRDNVELVDLCFYFENMPAPDQLAALILHVKAGNEDDIVTTGNTIRTYPAGKTFGPLIDLQEVRKRRNETRYGNVGTDGAAVAGMGPGAFMLNHIDTALFGGRRGSSDFYNANHDRFVPRLAEEIVDIARETRAGRFLSDTVPEAARLISVPRPSRTDAVAPDEIEFDLYAGQLQFQPARRAVAI